MTKYDWLYNGDNIKLYYEIKSDIKILFILKHMWNIYV